MLWSQVPGVLYDEWRYRIPARWDREWRRTATIEDQARFVSGWLTGEFRYLPGYAAPAGGETLLIRDELLEINRLGLVTHQSQPGLIDSEVEQHAWLSAYGSAQDVERVARACAEAGLWTSTDPDTPGARTAPEGPVTVTFDAVTGEGFTTAELWLPREEFPIHPTGLRWGRKPQTVWQSAPMICIVDPVRGRNTLLWETVIAALTD